MAGIDISLLFIYFFFVFKETRIHCMYVCVYVCMYEYCVSAVMFRSFRTMVNVITCLIRRGCVG